MADQENRQTVERFYGLIGNQDWDSIREFLHEGFIQEWPQSGERIRGADNALGLNQNYPGLPKIDVRRVLASGDLVTAEVTLNYPDAGTYQGVSIFEFRDGRIAKETDYFAQSFQAPEWRSKWVEKM
jgi:ketosteroid isomerase-like protein